MYTAYIHIFGINGSGKIGGAQRVYLRWLASAPLNASVCDVLGYVYNINCRVDLLHDRVGRRPQAE